MHKYNWLPWYKYIIYCCNTHRVENARLAASMVEKERDLQLATEGMQARVERLASELESAMVKAELLSAKGQMYDDLKAKTDRLEQENQRLQVD